jgi:hypothetical protein
MDGWNGWNGWMDGWNGWMEWTSINQSINHIRYITAVEKSEISIVKQDCTQKVNIEKQVLVK